MKIVSQTFTFFLFLILCLNGCTSKPAKFYVLTPLKGSPTRHHQYKHIGLGPVAIPDFLKRPQIVTRIANHQLKINEYHRWAEQFVENVRHVIEQNLQVLIPTPHVSDYPWPVDKRIDYRIDLEFARFDTEMDGDSILDAQWKITDKAGQHIYLVKSTRLHRKADPLNFASIVLAMNNNLTSLTRQIAKEIKRLPRQDFKSRKKKN